MENITLIDASKPEVVQSVLNEIITKINLIGEIESVSAESIGLGNVDNTSDANKPVSTLQKSYIDTENAKDVKLTSATAQTINSDIVLGANKKLSSTRGDNSIKTLVDITNNTGFENVEVGSNDIPLRLNHNTQDINGSTVDKHIKTIIKNGNQLTEEKVAYVSDVNTLKSQLDQVESIAKGANQAVAYADYNSLISALNDDDGTLYNVGQSIFIRTKGVCDVWVYAKTTASTPYTYTNDKAITSALDNNGIIQVGFYQLAMSETNHADISNLADKDELAAVESKADANASEILALQESKTTEEDVNVLIENAGKEDSSNKSTSISSSSTDTEYPSAKAVYDYVETALNQVADLLEGV